MNSSHNALDYTDITMFFFEPHPKLGFKFSKISKKWLVSEPYKLNDQRRQSNMSQVSQTSSQKGNNSVITTHEDTTKLKLI